GTLYPQQTDLRRRLDKAADDPDASGAEQDAPDVSPATDPVPDANSWLPASLGLSFYTDAADVEVSCAAARYETRRNETGRGGPWYRITRTRETPTLSPDRLEALAPKGPAKIQVTRRSYGAGSLVTVALINERRHGGDDAKAPDWDDMLSPCRLDVRPVD